MAGREAAAAEAGVPEAVVELPRLRVRQHLVGLRHLAKALFCVGSLGHVRVELAREPAERLLDVAVGRAALKTEDLVVVALGSRHRLKGIGAGRGRPGPPDQFSA